MLRNLKKIPNAYIRQVGVYDIYQINLERDSAN